MILGLGLGAPFSNTAILDAIRALFYSNEQGAWYDPSDMSTLFQDAAGTVPVTAVEQPVGLVLDKSGRGNHATQATTTKRPIYSRRVNFLTKTEQFDDAVWAKARCSVTSNAVVGPDGLMSADKVIADAQSNPHFISTPAANKSGTTCRISVYAKAGEWDSVMLFGANVAGRFNLSLGTYVSHVVGLPIAPTITPVGGGWYLLALSFVTTADTQLVSIRIAPSDGNSSAPGNGVDGLYLWGADCRLAADAHLPYQRVITDTDYDADPAKFPAYLRFDGVDDALQTGNIDFTGTDKMTVWAGLTQSVGTGFGCLLELSGNTGSNNGSLNLFAPTGASSITYGARGTTEVARGIATTSPANYFATSIINLAGATRDEALLARLNGIAYPGAGGGGNLLGGGMFGSYPLYIGARAGTSSYFNGRLYSLIVRGAQSSLSQIEATEAYIKQKMRLP